MIVDSLTYFLKSLVSMLIAVARLIFLTACFVCTGLQLILFSRVEICNLEIKAQPLRCDKEDMDDKLSYVDKLMIANPGLLDLPEREEPLLTEEELKALEDFDNDYDKDDEGDEDDSKGI